MFLQYFTGGATLPIMSLYLTQYLGFSGLETGLIISMSAVAVLLSPFFTVLLADRIIDAERLYGILHILGAGLIFLLYYQRSFYPVLILYLFYMLMFGSTEALTISITFHHSGEGGVNFGTIRRWGTIGWMAVAWLFSLVWLDGLSTGSNLSQALPLASLSSCITGLYAYTLPHVGCKPERVSRFFPKEALTVFSRKPVLYITLLTLFIFILEKYYYFGGSPFLKAKGFTDRFIMPAMTLGQVSEIFALSLLAPLLVRWGIKRIFLAGLLMQALKYLAFAFGEGVFMILFGIFCHGFAFAFYFTAAYIYLDSFCQRENRTGVHQIYSLVTLGVGGILGSLFAGRMYDLSVLSGVAAGYRLFWLTPCLILLPAFIVILFSFRESWWRKPQNGSSPMG